MRVWAGGLGVLLLSFLTPGCGASRVLTAFQYHAQPIPSGKEARTQAEVRQAVWRYGQRTLSQAYQRLGKHDARWDKAAVKYAERSALFFAQMPGAPDQRELLAQGKALIGLGCDDPLMLYLYGAALQVNDKGAESEPVLKRAVLGFEKAAYRRSRAFSAALRLARYYRQAGDERNADFERTRDLAVKWVIESAGDGSYEAGEQRVFLLGLSEDWDGVLGERSKAIYDGLRANSSLDPYITKVIGGWYEIDRAWEARGSDWASNVTEEGWKGFAEHLAEARRLLTEAWKLHPEFPEAPTRMIRVVMGEGRSSGDTQRLWFDRAVAAQMDYEPAYYNLLWGMRPRWGGSYDAMYEFGLDCLATNRFDTRVPWQFFAVLDMVTEDLEGEKRYWLAPETYDYLEALFSGYEAATDGESRSYYRSVYAVAAWYCGHYPEARRLLDELGNGFAESALSCFPRKSLAEVKAEVWAFTGPLGARAQEAEALHQRQQLPEAASRYEQLAREGSGDPVAEPFLATRAAVVRLEAGFASGEWVPLLRDPSFAGWSKSGGKWTLGSDGAARGIWQDHYPWLDCGASFGRRFELRGELGFEPGPAKRAGEVCFALARATYREGTDEVMVFLSPAHQTVTVRHDEIDSESSTQAAEIRERNTFDIQVWDDVVNVHLNGKLLHHDVAIERDTVPSVLTIAMGMWAESPKVTLIFRNLEIRRLTSRPVAYEAGGKTR